MDPKIQINLTVYQRIFAIFRDRFNTIPSSTAQIWDVYATSVEVFSE